MRHSFSSGLRSAFVGAWASEFLLQKCSLPVEIGRWWAAGGHVTWLFDEVEKNMLTKMWLLFLTNPVMAAGLAQALGMAAGIINAFGLVAVFGGLIGACISALSERHVGGVKTSLVISAVGGLAWVIAQAMFAAGGTQTNLQMQAVN